MNKIRLKKIQNVILNINKVKEDIDMILNDEQDVFDNMPENLQCSYNGERSEDAITTLEESISLIDEIESLLNSIV